jgi:uncharacterized protein YpuA (DUF1002 family)
MRKIIISICFLFAINIVVGQEAVQIIDEIAIIIKAKNEQELSRHLAPHVEITLNDVPKEHTKVQALDVLVKFLKDLDITSYDIVHISEVDKESQYVITKLVTKNKTYSSSFFITKIKGKHLIREINFKDEVPTSH